MRRQTKEKIITALMVLLFTVSMGFLSGCGAYKDPGQQKSDEIDARLGLIEWRLGSLEALYSHTLNEILHTQIAVDNLSVEITEQGADVQTLEAQLVALISQATNLQLQANSAQLAITQLQMNVQIVALVNPCGDNAGYDEVGFKTANGEFIFYFESGNKRHLTVLEPGVWYATTDQSACTFRIINGNVTY